MKGPFGLGLWEILVILLVILLLFGARKLPELGSSLGKGIRSFKSSVTGEDEKARHSRQEEQPTAVPAKKNNEPPY
ncbi:MAG: twin-arginine translocase TatA/TatE family subunit [SAR202 cluster bacterium]|nr:twin-arginine translocase TatA/TatE family subunit [SAR202 cluster bacterium]